MKKLFLIFSISLTVLSAHAHEHFAAGYLDKNGNNIADAGDGLQLVTKPAKGAVFHMLMETAGQRYGGYYSLNEKPRDSYPEDYFTFIALSDGQTELDGSMHAATGSDIWMEIASVSGPEGGKFGFWDIDPDSGIGWSYTHTTPTVEFAANQPTGGYVFHISEPLTDPVDPTEDPYGHIHDRGFTADVPGIYIVGFRLHDLSTNGPGGGSIQQPSQIYSFVFTAGVPDPTAPTVSIKGAAKRTVRSSAVTLRGTADASLGLTAVQVKTKGPYRTVSTDKRWKVRVKLKKGNNRIAIRAVDELGTFSKIERVVIRRR